MPRYYVLNLVSIIALGVAVSGWFFYYTDWFEIVGGLLALGGVLSWLAFVSKILPEDRIKELQKRFDTRVLCNPYTWVKIVVVVVGLTVLAACFGTIELKTRQRAGEYLVHVRPASALSPQKANDFVTVPAGGSIRTVRWIFGRTLEVHVKGYPTIPVTIRPFTRNTLVVPDSFIAPVVLLRPVPTLIDAARKNNKTLLVVISDERGNPAEEYTMKFAGVAIWVGGDDDIELPTVLAETWQRQLAAKEASPYFEHWAHPRSLFRDSYEANAKNAELPPLRLIPGQKLKITLFKDDTKSEVFAGPFDVPVVARKRWEDFPQVTDLDWK